MPRKPPKLTRARRAAAVEYALCVADWWERPVASIPHMRGSRTRRSTCRTWRTTCKA